MFVKDMFIFALLEMGLLLEDFDLHIIIINRFKEVQQAQLVKFFCESQIILSGSVYREQCRGRTLQIWPY